MALVPQEVEDQAVLALCLGLIMEKVLIRMPNWVGDFVMAIPALKNLSRAWLDKGLYVMTRPHLRTLMPDLPNLKGFIPYDNKKGFQKLKQLWMVSKGLRREDFSKAILFQNAFESALLAKMSSIREVAGYNRDLRGLLLTRPVRYIPRKKHHVYYYLELLENIGIEPYFERPRLSVSEAELRRAERILMDGGLKKFDHIIGIAPGAAYGPAKMWPLDNYKRLISKTLSGLRAGVIILGTSSERHLGEALRIDKERIYNLCGATDLGTAKALISICELFVSNDSGLMHLAASLDIPLVAIFGSTDPIITGPLSPNAMVLKSEVKCAPCFRPICEKGTYECLVNITVEEVYDTMKKQIGE